MTAPRLDIGAALRPADGFPDAGDAVVVRRGGGTVVLALIDALGHGPEAHAVAARAQELVESSGASDPAALLAMLDEELSGGLGAAAGIAAIPSQGGAGTYAGVGNTVARIFGRMERRLVSSDGIVGQGRVLPRATPFRLEPGDTLVLHSDGITSRFALADYPALLSEEPRLAARELIRRFGRSHDDAAAIVARCIP